MTNPPRRRRASGLGRILRSLAGVNEAVLDQIPTERARYASMGGVVLGTALVATLSMAIALYSVFGGFSISMVFLVPVWGLFVLNLDRWLMSTSAGASMRRRLAVLVPRLVLAIAFGVIIAEPLLLGVFRTAIEERVSEQRQQDLVGYASRLRLCNPIPGTPEATSVQAHSSDCAQLRLVIPGGSPDAKQRELEEKQSQAKALKTTVDTDAKNYAALQEKARQECDGVDGPGLTGDPGVGYECERLREQADAYKRDHRIEENSRRLAGLESEITKLTTQTQQSRQTFANKRAEAIEAEIKKRQAAQKSVGLLERFGALGELVKESSYVLAAEWALRIFFILVDALPVIVKFLSGVTPYDRLVADLVESQERRQGKYHADLEKQATANDQLRQRELDRALEVRLRKVDQAATSALLEVDAEREQQVDARAGYLLEEAWGGWWRPPRD